MLGCRHLPFSFSVFWSYCVRWQSTVACVALKQSQPMPAPLILSFLSQQISRKIIGKLLVRQFLRSSDSEYKRNGSHHIVTYLHHRSLVQCLIALSSNPPTSGIPCFFHPPNHDVHHLQIPGEQASPSQFCISFSISAMVSIVAAVRKDQNRLRALSCQVILKRSVIAQYRSG